MDSRSGKKALFRAKMKEHDGKKSKRINSPIVRYNEFDQPVCRVCDVTLKSESAWQAHQVSRKHHEAINSLKEKASRQARAAVKTQIKNIKSENHSETTKQEQCYSVDSDTTKSVKSLKISKNSQSSNLPANFSDDNQSKRQKTKLVDGSTKDWSNSQDQSISHTEDGCAEEAFSEKGIVGSENREGKNRLPEGFFDNKDADLRARGIQPVKPDIKDEYKEYERFIQQDLHEVDDRLEEEEYDAADVIEEEEFMEQRAYKEKVEELRKRRLEAKVEVGTGSYKEFGKVKPEESSEDDDSDMDGGGSTVDWRAKHV